MTDRPGALWAVIQQWLDTFEWNRPSQREMAKKLEVSKSTFSDYKYGRTLPPSAFLASLSTMMQVPYERVLDAALRDAGYRAAPIEKPTTEDKSGNPRASA